MFITNEADLSPLSALFGESGVAYWRITEIALNRPWFAVTLYERDAVSDHANKAEANQSDRVRTLLVTDVADLISLANSVDEPIRSLRAVHVVTPSHVNGTGDWQFERLSAVWTSEYNTDGKASGQLVDVLETTDGKMYPFFPTNVEGMSRGALKLLYSFPVVR